MSTIGAEPASATCMSEQRGPCVEPFPARSTSVGDLELRRALPARGRRLVGPWCFLDRYGPLSFTDSKPMDVAPHPHIGLQTVSWLLEGEVLHRDSLGFESLVRPGELNVMTAGYGISHSEETPRENGGGLSGVQLWVALPDAERHCDPGFEHYPRLPELELVGGRMVVFMGEAPELSSPATTYDRMIGAEISAARGSDLSIPVDARFEHAMFVLYGDAKLADRRLDPDVLYYLGMGREEISIRSREGARILLIGGIPFPEPIVMWWNFVARTHDEIEQARADWEHYHVRFGDVPGYPGPRLAAPPIRGKASPPPAS